MSQRDVANNGRESRLKMWAAFDRMPPAVRQAIAYAPYDYECGSRLDDLNALVAVGGRQWATARQVENMQLAFAHDVGDVALKVYGREHPQAIVPSPRKKK